MFPATGMTETGSDPDTLEGPSNEFLIAQYYARSDSFWRNEELRERRVDLPVTLVTVVQDAMVALTHSKGVSINDWRQSSAFALIGLLLSLCSSVLGRKKQCLLH